MTANNEDLAVCRFYQDLHAFEEACKQADLHPELHRDRMAMVNIGTIVEQKTVTDVKDPREQLLLNDPNSNTEKSLVAASMAKIVKKTEKKDKGRGKAGSCRKSTVGGDSSMTPGGTVKRGRRFSIGGAKPMKTVYVLDPIRRSKEHAMDLLPVGGGVDDNVLASAHLIKLPWRSWSGTQRKRTWPR